MPTCAECMAGRITQHSDGDRCSHANNVNGFHPYALRHDETLCGSAAVWFLARPAPDPVYKAAAAAVAPTG